VVINYKSWRKKEFESVSAAATYAHSDKSSISYEGVFINWDFFSISENVSLWKVSTRFKLKKGLTN
jgi:hypothetical protein